MAIPCVRSAVYHRCCPRRSLLGLKDQYWPSISILPRPSAVFQHGCPRLTFIGHKHHPNVGHRSLTNQICPHSKTVAAIGYLLCVTNPLQTIFIPAHPGLSAVKTHCHPRFSHGSQKKTTNTPPKCCPSISILPRCSAFYHRCHLRLSLWVTNKPLRWPLVPAHPVVFTVYHRCRPRLWMIINAIMITLLQPKTFGNRLRTSTSDTNMFGGRIRYKKDIY